MKNIKLAGFIPLFVIPYILLGVMAITGGGYYAVKHNSNQSSLNETKDIIGNKATTTITFSNGKSVTYIGNATDADIEEMAEAVGAKPSTTVSKSEVAGNSKKTSIVKKEDITDFSTLIFTAKEQINLLEQDRENFELLRKTIDEHKQKSLDQNTSLMNIWIDLADSSISIVPAEAQPLLRHIKDNIMSDSDYVKGKIGSYYSLLDYYFINSLLNKDVIDVITSQQKDLNDCIKNWESGKEDAVCIFSIDFIPTNRKHNPEYIKKIIKELTDTDNLVLDMIDKHTTNAKDEVTSGLSSIQNMSNIVAGVQSQLNQLSQQAIQNYSKPLVNSTKTSSVSTGCDNPISKRVLVVGKGFVSMKQCSNGTYIEDSKYMPNTSGMTPQQVCDMRKSAWLGQVIGVNSPDCSDLGL